MRHAARGLETRLRQRRPPGRSRRRCRRRGPPARRRRRALAAARCCWWRSWSPSSSSRSRAHRPHAAGHGVPAATPPPRSRAARSPKARPSTARSATAARSNCMTGCRGPSRGCRRSARSIARGGTLFRVNNLPVALMYGSVPAYRTLKEGVSDGPDVAELNENLIDLGYDPYGAIADDEGSAKRPPPPCAAGRRPRDCPKRARSNWAAIVFAPGARRVTAVKVALGQDPPGAPGAAGSTRNRNRAWANRPKKPGSTEKAAREKAAKETGGERKPRPRKKPAKESPAERPPRKNRPRKEPARQRTGLPKMTTRAAAAAAGAGMVVLSTTSTQQLVQLKLKAEQQTLARVGESAPVTLPGGGVVQGRIIEVGSVAKRGERRRKRKEEAAAEEKRRSRIGHDPRDARARASGRPPRRGAGQRRIGQEHPPRRARRTGDRADGHRRRWLRDRGARRRSPCRSWP